MRPPARMRALVRNPTLGCHVANYALFTLKYNPLPRNARTRQYIV